jgi:hypothetical protein
MDGANSIHYWHQLLFSNWLKNIKIFLTIVVVYWVVVSYLTIYMKMTQYAGLFTNPLSLDLLEREHLLNRHFRIMRRRLAKSSLTEWDNRNKFTSQINKSMMSFNIIDNKGELPLSSEKSRRLTIKMSWVRILA